MPSDYVPQADDPVGGVPILLTPATYARHATAVDDVERENRALYPRSPRGRTTRQASGAWGYLATGHSISGASGLSLGSGTVQLCSRSGGTLTADGDDVDVLNSGKVIDGPKILPLLWTDGGWSVCVCSVGCKPCAPCGMPQKDLAVSFHHIIFGDQTGTIFYDGGSTWGATITFGSPPTGLTISFQCFADSVFLLLTGGLNCQYPWVSTSNAMFFAAFTCEPFHMEFKFHNTSPLTDCASLFSGSFFIDDPDPPTSCPCSNIIHVNGCNGLSLEGADVAIKDAGGSTVDTGTTDAIGDFSPGETGFFGVDVSKTRFATNSSVGQTLDCTGVLTKSMSLVSDSGYRCFHGCADPVSETLTLTFAIAGAVTLTYSLGQWAGTFSASGQSYAAYIDATGAILIQRNGSNCAGVTMTVTSCPPSFAASITISGTCASEVGSTAVLSE